MTVQRIEQLKAFHPEAESVRVESSPRVQSAALPAQPNAAWQKLTRTSSNAPAGLTAPATTGATFRSAERTVAANSATRRAELVARERQALTEVYAAMLEGADDAVKQALEVALAAELAAIA